MPETMITPEPIVPDEPALSRRPAFSRLRAKGSHYLLLLFLIALLSVMMVYPILTNISAAFMENSKPTLFWIKSVLGDANFRSQLFTSLLLAVTVTFICNLIAFPLALLSQRFDFRGKTLLASLVLVPMVLPPFIGAIGMKQILGTFGSLTVLLQDLHLLNPHTGINWLNRGGFAALAGLISLGLYPIAYLNLQASLANIDPAMLEAAQNLGGKRFYNFWKITLPLAMPGIFAGSTIIFIWAFTELGTPLLLDYRNVVSRSLWDDLASAQGGSSSTAFAKAVIILAISITAYIFGKFTLGRSSFAMTSKAAVAAVPRKLRGMGAFLASLPFLVVTGLAMLPHIGVILYSFTAIATEPAAGWGPDHQFGWYRSIIPSRYTFSGYQGVFQTPDIYHSIINSIQYAGISTLINIVLGVAIAWVLVRTRVWGRTVLDTLAMLPLAVPGLVMAYGFIAVLRNWNLSWLLDVNPIYVLVIAYAVRRMPYLVRSAAGGLQQTSETLEEAAANLGASPLKVMWKVTLPLIMANLIAGSLLTFSFAMLEVSDSLLLAKYPQHFPITKMIYSLANDTSGPENVRNACALGVFAMLLLITTMLTAGLLMGKKLGAVFRA